MMTKSPIKSAIPPSIDLRVVWVLFGLSKNYSIFAVLMVAHTKRSVHHVCVIKAAVKGLSKSFQLERTCTGRKKTNVKLIFCTLCCLQLFFFWFVCLLLLVLQFKSNQGGVTAGEEALSACGCDKKPPAPQRPTAVSSRPCPSQSTTVGERPHKSRSPRERVFHCQTALESRRR